jgi:hypothetical protein
MINPRELRIGNLVRGIDAPYPASIEGIDPNGGVFLLGDSIPWEPSEVSPIPLTEEWLVKFGFKAENDLNLDFRFPNGTRHLITRESDSGWYYGFECYLVELPNIELNYVHQLQNLYFALTGEELTIKE